MPPQLLIDVQRHHPDEFRTLRSFEDLAASRASYSVGAIQHTETGGELIFSVSREVNTADAAVAIHAKKLDRCID
jgi:hypothetical protein